MIDEDHRAARPKTSRRGLLAGAGAVAGLGLAGGLGVAGGLALDRQRAAAPLAAPVSPAPVSPAVTLLRPSGDTSGVTDHQAIQRILTPTEDNNWGQSTAVLLGSGVFYIHQTIASSATCTSSASTAVRSSSTGGAGTTPTR
jgi:hypothetical protein